MARKVKNTKDLMRGMSGWERQYIKKSIEFGHLDVGTKGSTNKQGRKYGSK